LSAFAAEHRPDEGAAVGPMRAARGHSVDGRQ
jgi:hypothetical protein